MDNASAIYDSDLEFRFLSRDMMPQIHNAFSKAFEDYAMDSSQVTERILTNRAIKNGVSFENSIGAFDGDELVGFTLVGLEERDAGLAAYDIATGIVKEHRGKGLAGAMFQKLKFKLSSQDVRHFYLEVLQVNTAAVRAYEKAGFLIVRELDSYRLPEETPWEIQDVPENVFIGEASREELAAAESFLDWQPSWENTFASLRRIPDDLLLIKAEVDGELAGIAGFYPTLGWIVTLAVDKKHRRKKIGTFLLDELYIRVHEEFPNMKIINIDYQDKGMANFLKKQGFVDLVNQYEMMYTLPL